MITMYKYILFFLIFSFSGWLMEVIFKFIQNGKFVNRGFLVGPVCPIYGVCGLIFYFIFSNISYNFLSVFVISFLLCAAMEYFASYILEELFHARWWDYSHKKYNLNGRICLRNLLFFGAMGCFCVYFFNSFVLDIIDNIPSPYSVTLAYVLLPIFIIDVVVSVQLVSNLKDMISSVRKDATEEISKKIKSILLSKSIYFRRVILAYPNFKFSPKYLSGIKNKISKYKNKKKS